MARNMYGATSADFTLTSGGRPIPNQTLTLWTARTGGTQITDLTDVYGVACTTVLSGADGSVVYYGPDNDKTAHWAQAPQGNRFAIRPVDITGEAGPGSGILTTKGDILVRHSDADTRLPVGADGKLLIADSTQSTGLGWVGIGNLLTANQASGTDTLGDITGWSEYQSTLSSTTSIQKSGTRCLVITPIGTGAAYAFTSDRMAVTAGVTYTFTAALRSDAGTGETGRIRLEWYDAASGGTYLGESAGTTVTLNSSAWQVSTMSAVVPTGATYAAVQVYRAAGAVGVPMYVDEVGLWKGAGGKWAMPGTPIVGGSHIATNGAVHLSGTGTPEGVVTAAPGSTWLQTDATTDVKGWIRWIKATGTGNTGWVVGPEADTGLRDVSASLLNGWTGSVITRRIGNAVTLWLYRLAAGSDGHALTLPSGFRNAYIATMPFGAQKAGVDTSAGMAVGAITWDDKVLLPTSGATDLICEVHLMTADTWPSSLPGSAA